MKIIKTEGPFPVVGSQPETETSLFYHFPSMEKLSNGEILLCCKELHGSMNDSKGKILMFRSADQGKTWVKGIAPTCNDEVAYPGKGYAMAHITEIDQEELIAVYGLIDTDKNKPMFNPQTDGMQNEVVRITKSFTNGNSWSQPKNIEFESADIIIPSKIINLPDGTLGFPCEMHDHWEGGYKEGNCSRFIKSYDRGNTFPEGKIMAADKGILYGDARSTFIENRLVIFLWTLDLAKMKDLPIHFISTENSAGTWSNPSPINITTQIMSPMYLGNGLMLAIHQDRFSDSPGLKAMLSYDSGLNWDKKTEITLFSADKKPDGTNPFAQFNQFQFGYSSLLKTGDSTCLASFWHTNGVTTSISVTKISVENV
ncbi:MAG: exo-alpha-sialidase [Candidatus Brocadiales bacterium]|nr:exo-alpha-sialidase [Candidatus Brocadiales bacterium]